MASAINSKVDNRALISSPYFSLAKLDTTVGQYYSNLKPALHAALSVFGAMTLKNRTRPLSLIFEGCSGAGKTAVLQMAFPLSTEPNTSQFVYRSDKFTPKAFVTHSSNVKAEDLPKMDLLPKLRNRVLITKELAPIFRGRAEELQDNFSILIAVLDGKGFTSDTGARGRRGYQEDIVFNWLGATTPLPASTHRLMSQLGTRLLFYEIPSLQPTEEELIQYAKAGNAGEAEDVCQQAVNRFLHQFTRVHSIGSVDPKDIGISDGHFMEIVRWASFLVNARAEVIFEQSSSIWEPVAVAEPEGPFKVVNYFKEMAIGHALVSGRMHLTESDLDLVSEVAISSTPAHLRPVIRELRESISVDTARCAQLCRVSVTTARRYLKELSLLGIVDLTKGSPATNDPDMIQLKQRYHWLRQNLEHEV
jgi:hypothetical protein